MRIALCNVNNLVNKINIVHTFIIDNNIDIFGVTETWLRGSVPDVIINLDSFNVYRKDTSGSTAKHGVCMYVRKEFICEEIDIACDNLLCIRLVQYNVYLICPVL